MKSRWRLLAVITAAMGAVALGACSSSNKPASTGDASGGQPTSAKSGGSPIKVGFICSCSGEGGFLAQNVPVENTYKAWANTVNGSGGINGHPVQVVAEDDGGNPGKAVSAAQTLISDHVDAIVDNSVVDVAFASAVEAAKVPVVELLTNGTTFATNPDFYPEAQTNDSVLYAIVATAKAAGATNIGDIYCAEAAQCAQTVPLMRSAGKQLGVPDVYNAEISATAPNYTAQCLAAKQQHVSALFLAETSNENVRFARCTGKPCRGWPRPFPSRRERLI